jgi:hypothetical protein
MALTIDVIKAAPNKKELIELLSAELHRLLPEEVQEDRDLYYETVECLPAGLRSMAGIYAFDIAMADETLISYFCNLDDEREFLETVRGLRELELPEIAEHLEKTQKFMVPHMEALNTLDFGGKEFPEWLEEIGAIKELDPLDEKIQLHLKKCGRMGLLESWPLYARKYPERCVVAEA